MSAKEIHEEKKKGQYNSELILINKSVTPELLKYVS